MTNDSGKTPLSEAEKAVEKALNILRDHYDACSIFLNGVDVNGNHVFNDSGFGNNDTRFGSVRRWLIREEESIKQEVLQEIKSAEQDNND